MRVRTMHNAHNATGHRTEKWRFPLEYRDLDYYRAAAQRICHDSDGDSIGPTWRSRTFVAGALGDPHELARRLFPSAGRRVARGSPDSASGEALRSPSRR